MKRTPPPAGFDLNVFGQNVDPDKVTRTLKVGGKEVELPALADVNLSTAGPFIRVKWGEVEHRELQLACESRSQYHEQLYDTSGNLVAELYTDSGWAVSGAPQIGLADLDNIRGLGKVQQKKLRTQ